MLEVVTPAGTSDLTVLATLKAELQIADADSDDYLSDLIRQASDAIARYCGRTTFARETYRQTERIARPRATIVLDRDIEPEIASVTVDGVALGEDAWELDGSLLYRLDAADCRVDWDEGLKVVITYDAGYTPLTTVPYDLERCCLDLCRMLYSGRGRDPTLKSERILDVVAFSYATGREFSSGGGIPQDIAERLAPYRLIRFA